MSSKNHTNLRGRACLVLFLIYFAALTYLYFGKVSKIATLPKEIYGIPFDQIGHFLMFLPFPFLAHGSLKGKRKWRNLLFIFFSGIVIAYAFELLQEKVSPFRTTDPWDLVINIASLTIATFIMSIIDLFRK